MTLEPVTPPRSSSMGNPDTHVTVLAVLNFLAAGIVLFGGLVATWGVWFAGAEGARWSGMAWFPEMMGSIAFFVAGLALLVALPALLAGIGLSMRQEWGRILALVAAALIGFASFFSFTFIGLAYAGYAFWALTRPEVAELFRPSMGGPQQGVV